MIIILQIKTLFLDFLIYVPSLIAALYTWIIKRQKLLVNRLQLARVKRIQIELTKVRNVVFLEFLLFD